VDTFWPGPAGVLIFWPEAAGVVDVFWPEPVEGASTACDVDASGNDAADGVKVGLGGGEHAECCRDSLELP
jgi:hypothetical protein